MYSCQLCSKKLSFKSGLHRHLGAIHRTKKHSCKLCNKIFNRKDSLKRHTDAVHRRIRDHICCYCGWYFGQKYDLDVHVNRRHINPLPPAVSRGEQLVRCALTDYDVRFEVEKKFGGLKGSRDGHLRYDFAIPGRDDRYLLIEFQGRQHYEPVRYSSEYTEIELLEKLRVTKLHDNLKVRYAKERGFPLLVIRYDETSEIDRLVGDFLAENLDML